MEAEMTRVWTGATVAFAVACAVAVAAQTSTSSSQSDRDRTITVTGCLERGDQTPAGTTGTSGTSTSARPRGEWILTNATMGSGSSSGSYSGTSSTGSTTTGTAGTTSSMSGSGSSYVLVGKSDELSKHAGHKSEVTG